MSNFTIKANRFFTLYALHTIYFEYFMKAFIELVNVNAFLNLQTKLDSKFELM